MDSVNRWCEKCFSGTPHTVIHYGIGTRKHQRKIIGKKIIFGYRCEICAETTTLKPEGKN